MEQQELQQIKDSMLAGVKQAIKDEIALGHKGLSDQIVAIKNQIDEVKDQVAPITKVYTSFTGFGSVLGYMFKYIVIPASILVGILANYHRK